MKTRTIVEHSTFKKLMSFPDLYTKKNEKQSYKNQLMNIIQNSYGDKWFRLKQGTRDMLSFIVFLSAEKGFVYSSANYLAAAYDITPATVRTAVRYLRKHQIIYIAHRRLGHFNLPGKAVLFFSQHPYFQTYYSPYFHTGIPENAEQTVAEGGKTVSTYALPKELFKDSSKDRQADQISDSIGEIPDSIPEGFRRAYKRYFPIRVQSINRLYRIAHKQFWKANIEKCHYETAAVHALEQMVGQMKIKRIKNKLAYWTATCKGVAHAVFADELEAMGADLSAY
ncbi:hypothetical protein OYT88_12270 [Sporolactobacillus sp. CQH2019]|uniref:hypothetical protein n=1 Tax=Sporolactobacillus sp. CQH2019 TaxID=3023512 RepID=UPI0023684BB5|nr:hypothetical protein [Sporolactobacillus sp. CQH2019]MDD9149316.1 hypothetical protein [Sporolactobacillus sp. CQH2019]